MDGRTKKGITLLEVLLVLILLSGISYILLSKIPVHSEQQMIDIAATRLLTDLRETRQAAIAENVWHEVFFYPNEGRYRINRGPTGSSDVTKIKEEVLPAGVKFENLGQLKERFLFHPNGTPSRGLTITLKNSYGKLRKVIVAPVEGRIREE